jgi:hypothetical protein
MALLIFILLIIKEEFYYMKYIVYR